MEKNKVFQFVDGRGKFRFEIKLSENRRYDEKTGYLYCDNAILGHTGVQEYYAYELGMGQNEIIKVNRFAEDVFSDEAMASIKGKSVTKFHPTKWVTKDNYKTLEIGTILDVRKDGDNVIGDLVIKDPDAIMDILDGNMEALSLGYEAKLVKMEDSDEYKQVDLYINHVALVKQGRAVNARIADEELKEKENRHMGVFNFLKNKKVQINDDDTLTILEDTLYVNKSTTKVEEERTYDSETGEETTKRKVEEETKSHQQESATPKTKGLYDEQTEVKPQEDITKSESKTDEETTTNVADETNTEKETEEKEFNDMDAEQLKAFREELKKEVLAELKETSKGKGLFDDVNPLDTDKLDQKKQTLELNYEKDEQLRKRVYDKMTNPVAHGGDFKAMKAFAKKAQELTVE